jgi:hypothetical protein
MSNTRPTVRLIASDIDGTLLDPDGVLTERTRRTLRQLPALGVAFAFVTGLNPWVVQRWVQEIGEWTHAVCLNGIFTLESGHPVPGRLVNPLVAREAATLMLDHGYVPLVYGEDQISRYLPWHPEGLEPLQALIAERPYQPYVPVASLEDLFSVRPATVSVCETQARGAALSSLLMVALGDRAYVVHQPSSPAWGTRTWVEVNHPDARKDLGLLALAHKLGIEADEVLYFGDSLNDLPVFEVFRHTVAVENARPEVRRLAWRTTSSNADDGVARFLAAWFDLELT